MVRILIIDQANFIGGAELFNLDLINNLDDKKNKLFLLTSGNPDYTKHLHSKIDLYFYSFPKLKTGFFKYFHLFKAIFLVRQIVKREKIDLIQSNTIRGHVISALAKKIFRLQVKLAWFVHDFTFPQGVLKKVIKVPDMILTCSQVVKKDLLEKTSVKFKDKIKVVYNGIDLEKITNYESRITKKQDKKRVGIIGRLDPWKGQDVFIQAAEKVLRKKSNVEFVIIGTASKYDQATLDFEKKLKQMVVRKKLQTKVVFLGKVSEIYPEIQKMDILVHASTQTEPFGRVIIEAMSMGKVVIASNLGGPREIITDGEDGFLIEAGNVNLLAEKILEVLSDTKFKAKIKRKAQRKVAQKFNLKKQIAQIEDSWEKILSL